MSESALGTRLHATQALLRWRRASQVDGVDIATRETPLRVFMRSMATRRQHAVTMAFGVETHPL